MTSIEKIDARREVVAKTYTDLMRWAKKVHDMPADASEDIEDYYRLSDAAYAVAVEAGMQPVVSEYKGLTTERDILA